VDTRTFVDHLDDGKIVEAIRAAEARTRGEIRVHVTSEAVGDPHAAAAETFVRLGMARTAERNGVLLFVSPRAQTFAVIGDVGVHERCGQGFWREVAAVMQDGFRQGRFLEAVLLAIAKVGDLLAQEFPRPGGGGDRNELPDDVSRD
jgi:uncharacterized membrane protein